MIRGQFRLGGDLVDVVIKGNELMFMDVGSGMITTVDGLKFSKAGVLLEHPDLKDKIEWKKEAIVRLKEHIKQFKTEMKKMIYVKEELIKFGYDALHWQKAGWRVNKFK